MEESILSRPYSERQLIVVTDDEVATALQKAEEKAAPDDGWVDVTEAALRLVLPYGIGTSVVNETIKLWKRLRETGVPDLYVGKTEAEQLTFQPGNPRAKVVYVGHPVKPETYFTMADFHRVTFEFKFVEAIRLLMHLGASRIRVESTRGWSREFAGKLSLEQPTPKFATDAKVTRKSCSRLLYEATLPGTTEPALPESLIWYEHEPTWQSIAEGRLKFGLRDFALNVTYEDDYGVNAGLKVSAKKAGFKLGGKFEDHEATVWKISGTFGTN